MDNNEMTMQEPFFEVSGIYKSFGKTEVLKGIDFTLEKGQVLSIIGASGNGKSTLLRCLNFLETAEQGTIRLNGELLFNAETAKIVKEKELRMARIHMGLVFQSFNLFPQYTAFDNIKMPLALMEKDRAKHGLPPICSGDIDDEVNTLLEKVGLSDKANFYPCQLSGGQCQRVAIARAMALKPDILCFDEPTSALDPELTGEVLKVIRSLKDQGITMIIVTHEMEFAHSVSDKVIFMHEGVVAVEGTPSEVFDNPTDERLKSFLAVIE